MLCAWCSSRGSIRYELMEKARPFFGKTTSISNQASPPMKKVTKGIPSSLGSDVLPHSEYLRELNSFSVLLHALQR